VIETINLDRPGNWEEGNPRELYERLSEHPHNYGVMTRTGTEEAAWMHDFKNFIIVQGQAEEMSQALQENYGSLNPLINQLSAEFNITGDLSQVNIAVLLERARSARALLAQMTMFFQTSFEQLGNAQTNTSRMLKQFEDENRASHALLHEQDERTAAAIKELTSEIQRLRELNERTEAEARARREKNNNVPKNHVVTRSASRIFARYCLTSSLTKIVSEFLLLGIACLLYLYIFSVFGLRS
jgi:septal ring factor EnvC (AmiA/AmiB activator)